MSDEENLNTLYQFAQAWYLENPGQQIPLDMWRRECDVFDESKMWEVFWPGHQAYGLSPRVVPELLDIDPLNFRKGHFEAIGAMAEKWSAPQELSDFDAMRLVGHTTSALAAYKGQRHIDFMKGGCTAYQDRATSQVITFISWLAPQISIDYASLAHLESSAKAILAKAGFDYKKLPGMTHRDKGNVLSEALGM